LGGIIVELNQKYMDACDHMNNNCHPYFKDLAIVSNGGDLVATTSGMGLLQNPS